MYATRPTNSLRLLIPIAAAALLAALLLLPAPVRGQVTDTTAPTLLGARVSGTSLVLVYNEALDTSSIPAASAYSVVVDSTAATPTGVGISGARVTLTLPTAATSSDTVTVTYTKPSTTPLQDGENNDVESFSGETVANHTSATNTQPVFSSATTTRSVAENTANGMNVGAVVSVTDTDTLTYALVGPDASSFTIETTSGQIQTSAALDFETTQTTYKVVVSVHDNKNAAGDTDATVDDAIAVTISVTDVNEAPVITTTTSTITKPEQTPNSEILATYTATDPDNGAVLTWTLDDVDAGDFTIVDGELKFRNEPDYENPADNDNNNSYTVTVIVSDGSLEDMQPVTITVTDVNEPPVITTTGSTYTAFSVAENTATSVVLKTYMADDPDAGDSLTWTKTGDDAGDFTLADGVLKFRNVPNFESPTDNNMDNEYAVAVNVRDTIGGNIDASLVVAVTVTNADEAGTASFTGTLSGGSTQTASVTDPDGSIVSKMYQWQRGDTAGGTFNGINTNGTSETYVPVAADVGKWLKVKVSYADAEGSGKSATSVSRGPIGASNSAPTFDDGLTAMRTLPENSDVGTNAGNAVEASDTDGGDTLTYAIKSGNDGASFDIDTTDGQLKSKTGVTYNFEGSKNSYTVIMTVHDGKDAAGGNSNAVDDEITVTINLTNVNEKPALTSPPTTKSVPENTTAVHEYAATDVDAGTVFSWSLSGADAGDFSISTSGVLTFSSAPDFENPTDSINGGGVNAYIVTVRVHDEGDLRDQHTLTVTVTDVNETPEITSGPATISKDENTPTTEIIATYVATDQDATTGTMTWDLQGNDAGEFTIMSTINGTATLHFSNVPNYEAPADNGTNNVYDVTVRVRDNGSTRLQDTQVLAVTVNDVNETPVISGGATPSFAEIEFDATTADLAIGTYTYTDEDRNPADTITWDLSGTDETHFSINSSSGVLSFSIEPNFEVPVDMGSGNDYVIVVEAMDNNSLGALTGTFAVTVTVTQVDETPVVTSANPTHNFAEIEYDDEYADVDLRVDIFTARDEEDGTGGITWAVSGTDGADFTISSGVTTGEGVLFFRPDTNRNIPDFERPGDDDGDNVYNIILKATDTTLPYKTRDYPVTVTVTDVDETPEFRSPSTGRHAHEIEYDSGTTAAELSSIPATVANQDYWYRFEVRDEERQDIIWSITGLDAADFVIAEDPDFVMTANADESAIARWNIVPNFEDPRGSSTHVVGQGYVFTVNASDGTNTATHEFFIRIEDVNEMPEFTGTPNLAITYNENAITDVSSYAARDEEGGVTWSLTGTDSGKFSIDSGGTVTFNATPDWETLTNFGVTTTGNVLNFTVVATDVESLSPRRDVSVDVTVTVADVEELGTVTVDNLNPAVGGRVKFTLTDPDGDIDVIPPMQGQPPPIDWTLQLRLPGGAWQTKQTNNPLDTDFHYVVDEDDEGMEMRAVVTYIDRRGPVQLPVESGATEAATADPIPNAPPRFTGEGGTQSIEEVDAGQTVGIPIIASDRDNDSLTFSIEGAHADKFELVVVNNTTVRLRTAQAFDFETTSGPLFLQVAVHDGKGLDATNNVISDDSIDATTTVTVTILDVEENGVLTLSDDEPGVGTRITTTLSDGDGMIGGQMWQWARSENGRDGWTNIGGTTSIYTTTQADADFFLRARVTYRDRRGSGKSAEAITTERVFGENQRPTFPSTETGARTVEENTRAGMSVGDPVAAEDMDDDRLTYSLSGTDAAAFSIVTTTGQLRTLEPLDFEDKSSYRVNVEVHDGLDGLGDPSTSIDDTQAVTITIENVEEQGTVTLSSDTGTIQARVPVTATLADDDRPSGTVTWQWARSPNGRTDWVNIAGATSATFEPTLAEDQGNYIRATASYTDGHGTADKTANAVSPRVGDAPPVNSAPVFPSTENGQREVAENTGSGNVGARFEATDFNNDTLYYSLSGTDAASFTIVETTGQLRLAPNVALDYEGKRTYRFTVEVSDGKDPLDDPDDPNDPNVKATDDRQSVTVTVTNVNEAPEVTGDTAPSFVENKSSAVASYSAADPERDTLTWTVSGSDFWISERGQLYFLTPPSFERSTTYTVTVMAEDDGGLRDSLSVNVTVIDVEEDGTVTITPPRGWVDTQTQLRGALDDDDGGETNIMWQWARSSNRSSWTDIVGATSSLYSVADDDNNQYLRVTATYDDRVDMGQTASAVLAGRIVDVRPTTNELPAFADTTDTRSGRAGDVCRPVHRRAGAGDGSGFGRRTDVLA